MARFSYARSTQRKEDLILAAKRDNPCVECMAMGLPWDWPPEAKQLDHLPQYQKRFYLSKLGQKSARMGVGDYGDYFGHTVAEVIEEISHCEVICANHHAIRTQQRKRRGWVQEEAGQLVLAESEPNGSWYEVLREHSPNIWD